jgi:hypothetical protein
MILSMTICFKGFKVKLLTFAWLLATSAQAISNSGHIYTALTCSKNMKVCVKSSPNSTITTSKNRCLSACNMQPGCGWIQFVEEPFCNSQTTCNSGNCLLYTSQPSTNHTSSCSTTLWQVSSQLESGLTDKSCLIATRCIIDASICSSD